MGEEWYGYVYKKNHTRFDSPKLLVPSISTGSSFASDLDGTYYFVGSGGGGGGGYGISLPEGSKDQYLYLLGLLNSKLVSTFLRMISTLPGRLHSSKPPIHPTGSHPLGRLIGQG